MNGCRPFACVGTQPGVDGHLGPEEQHNPRPNTITGPRDVCKAREEQLHRLRRYKSSGIFSLGVPPQRHPLKLSLLYHN